MARLLSGLVISKGLRLIIYFSICIIGKNMTKYSLGNTNMSIKFRLAAGLLGLFAAAGCMGTINNPVQIPPEAVECDENGNSVCTENNSVMQPAGGPQDSEFVNYTKVAADYKEYGERTPRDQNIVNGGAGSNMSAAIPPTVESEVIDYEEEIKENDTGSSNGSGEYSAEDPVEDWLAEEGQTLKDLLTEWSERSGWRLIWNSNRNYTLTAGAMFRGRFADVSSALIRAFARARPAPIATFYKGNRVLVVETMEDENAYE